MPSLCSLSMWPDTAPPPPPPPARPSPVDGGTSDALWTWHAVARWANTPALRRAALLTEAQRLARIPETDPYLAARWRHAARVLVQYATQINR